MLMAVDDLYDKLLPDKFRGVSHEEFLASSNHKNLP
jgi:hypothetical protein